MSAGRSALAVSLPGLLALAGATSCHARAFWQCTDPEPILRGLAPPPEGWLVHESGPGLFDGRCTSQFARTYGTNASEFQATQGMSDALERAGFTRVPATPDSPFWCERTGRFHQFSRGDLRLRFAVEPIPFRYAKDGVLGRGQARFGFYLELRNFDPEHAYPCPPRS